MKLDDALKSTWRLHLALDTRRLDPAVVQWAIFVSDPTVRFEQQLIMRQRLYQERMSEAPDAPGRERVKIAFLRTAWNQLFQAVSGDEMYLLTSKPGRGH